VTKKKAKAKKEPRRRDEYLEPAGAFRYYTTGSTWEDAEPDPPSPEEAKPFHVLAHSDHYIPISVLVFARDADHARARVMAALREALEKQHRPDTFERAKKHLEEIENGDMVMHVQPYDIKWIRTKVIWAGNGGVL